MNRMNATLVMTVIGADRPGLVERLAAVIADHGGNWLESRMAHLGGQFAGILRVQVPAARKQQVRAALQALAGEGLTIHVHEDAVTAAPAGQTLATVEVVGHDRPGIIRQISQVLAQQRVNVEELETRCESAPMSGEQLFHATATVQLPATCPLRQLRSALEHIAADLMVDVAVLPTRAP
jgi:glycine cleavage system regulatory protein